MESLTECQFRWLNNTLLCQGCVFGNSCWDIYSKDKGREWMISDSLAPSYRPTSGRIFLMTSSNKNSLQINEDGSDITVIVKGEMGRIQRKEKQTMFGRHMKGKHLYLLPWKQKLCREWFLFVFVNVFKDLYLYSNNIKFSWSRMSRKWMFLSVEYSDGFNVYWFSEMFKKSNPKVTEIHKITGIKQPPVSAFYF